MNRNKRLRQCVFFWGENLLAMLGMVLGATFLMLLLHRITVTDEEFTGLNFFSVYPYYLLLIGALLNLVYITSMFSMYYSVLLSVGVTRKGITCGITLTGLGVVAGLVLITALIRELIPGAAGTEYSLLPLFTGVWLFSIGAGMALGSVILRFGKIGAVILTIVLMLFGAGMGFLFASSGEVPADLLKTFTERTAVNFWNRSLLLAGLLAFAGGIGTAAVLGRRSEVRR